jgi:hypothetical protein
VAEILREIGVHYLIPVFWERLTPLSIVALLLLLGSLYLGKRLVSPKPAERHELLVTIGALLLVVVASGIFTAIRISPPATATFQGRGFYRDVKTKTTTGKAIETIHLSLYPNPPENGGGPATGRSHGSVEGDGETVETEWDESGNWLNDYVMLGYRTAKVEGNAIKVTGVGGYILRQYGQFHYIGFIVIYDDREKTSVICPYVLTTQGTEQGMAWEEAAQKYRQLNKECTQLSYEDSAQLPLGVASPPPGGSGQSGVP